MNGFWNTDCLLYSLFIISVYAVHLGICCLLLALTAMEEIAEAVEVALHDESDALRVERGTGEVAVVGLVVDLKGKVAVRGE